MDGQEPEVVETEEIQEVVEEVKTEPEKVELEPKEELEEVEPQLKKRLARWTKQKYELLGENEKLKEELKKYKTEQPAPKAPVPSQYTDAYGNFDEGTYQKDMLDFVDSHSNWKKGKAEAVEIDQKYQERFNERYEVFMEQVNALKVTNPEIEQIIEKPIYSKPLEAAILESDDSGKLILYLGKNESEIHKLNEMGKKEPWKIAEYLGMIEGKLNVLEKKKSNATEPIVPLGGNNGNLKDIDSITNDDEWYKERQKEKLRKLKGK
jgi:hypothetical protein